MVGPEIEARGAGAPREPHVRRRRAPARAVLRGRAAQGLRPGRDGDGRRRLPRAAVRPSPGRAASSARWDSKARCGSATARSSRPRPKAPSATRCSRATGRRAVREGQGDQHGGDARDRRRDRPGRQPALAASSILESVTPARAGRALHRPVVRRVGPVARLQRRVGRLVAEGDLVVGVAGRRRARRRAAPARYQRFTSSTHSSSFAMIVLAPRVRRSVDCRDRRQRPAIGAGFDSG